MATLTIRDLDPSVKERLRIRAAQNGRSMEEEARAILKAATVKERHPERGLGTRIRQRFAKYGGVELAIPPREPGREPPNFE
jgi:plasmid stability protein